MNIPESVSPERTKAIVVGVGGYVEDTWRLPGARQSAIEFANWLVHECKIPPDNVSLLITPTAAPDDEPSLPPSMRVRGATHDVFIDTVTDDLHAKQGDLLIFYWCGHGMLDYGSDPKAWQQC